MANYNYRQSRLPAVPTVIKYLILINVVVWVMELIWGSWFIDFFALHDLHSPLFKPHQLISYLFLHDTTPVQLGSIWPNPMHILLNMFALWMFGSILENYWGPKRFLNFYLICGIGAGILYLLVLYFFTDQSALRALAEFQAHPSNDLVIEIARHFGLHGGINGGSADDVYLQLKAALFGEPILGASGAIFGVLVAFGYTFPNTEMFIIPIPFPVKAKYLVVGYVLIELFSGVQNRAGDDVAHFAHLGGALVGFLLVLFWNRKNRRGFN